MERKKHAEKGGKAACKRKINVAHRQEILTMIGLGFLIRTIMTISM
jgi:hypothetical protein